MATSQRATLLAKVHKVLKKHYKPVSPPAERTLFEHLLFAACLENSHPDKAEEAFARLQQSFFDWNEVRVSTVAELAESVEGLPFPSIQASNLKRALQNVFEAHYAFDLEPLKKQNIGKAEEHLRKFQGATPFMIAYAVQQGLGGHSIPIDDAVLQVFLALGLVSPAEMEKHVVPGLERAIPKNKGEEFASLVQQLGADYVSSPNGKTFRAAMDEIDGEARGRLPKERLTPREMAVVKIEMMTPTPPPGAKDAKKPEAGKKPEAAKKEEPKKSPEKGDKGAEKSAKPAARGSEKSKPAERGGEKSGDKSAKKPKEKQMAAAESKPSATAKGLTKKKPR